MSYPPQPPWARAGRRFMVGNGIVSCTISGTGNFPLSIFNPSSSKKSILIYSAIVGAGASSLFGALTKVTVDPVYTTALTPVDAEDGGASSLASVTWTSTSQTAPSNSAIFGQGLAGGNVPLELIGDSNGILLPANANNGLVVWVQAYTTGYISYCVRYIEF